MSAFFDHPIVQKAAAGLIVAGAAAISGVTWTSYTKLNDHDYKIQQLIEMREDVRAVRQSVIKVEQDVAVLKDRSDRKDARDESRRTD